MLTRLVVVAVVGEAVLASVAGLWIYSRGLAVASGDPAVGVGLGLVAAAVLAGLNYALLRVVPPVAPVRVIRRLYADTLRPLFATVSTFEIAVVSLAAGLGEELLFRGAVQGEFGVVVASVSFGAAHIGGRGSLMFGLWVVVMGFGLGGLAHLGGGLLAPIVAHVAYDAAAIAYIRWDAASRPQRRVWQ